MLAFQGHGSKKKRERDTERERETKRRRWKTERALNGPVWSGGKVLN